MSVNHPHYEWCIECKVSGVSQSFTGTFDEAVKVARQSIRQQGWGQVLWVQPENRRVAEVWEDVKWISREWLADVSPTIWGN